MGNSPTKDRSSEHKIPDIVEGDEDFEAESFIDISIYYELSQGALEGPTRMLTNPAASLLSLKQDIAESRKMNSPEDVLIYIKGKFLSAGNSTSVKENGICNDSKLLIRDNSKTYNRRR